MLAIIVERRDTLAGTVEHHMVIRTNRGVTHVEKGDISAVTVLPIQIARIIVAEGMGAGVADFEAEVVNQGVRAKDKTRVREALVALIRRKKGQVQPRKKKKKRNNHHQKAL